MVDKLAERDEPLGRVRRQSVGVLFADLVGFTTLAEDMTPEEVMAMLRDFHGRMEEEVFRHGGCLEKFIGDALLATFGVPDTGTRDATDTLACARGMLAALTAWNLEREAAGLPPLRMGWGCTTARWWPATSAAGAAWPSPRWATPPTSPAGSRPSPASAGQHRGQRRAGGRRRARGRRARAPARSDDAGPSVLRGRDTPIELWAE